MILIDTSVWVSVMRSKACPEAATFASLLDADRVLLAAPVRTELLSGARGDDQPRLRRTLTALPVVYPTDVTWPLMDQWTEQACNRGQRFGVGDLLIGALAREAGALIWSLDADFGRMARLKFVELYQ